MSNLELACPLTAIVEPTATESVGSVGWYSEMSEMGWHRATSMANCRDCCGMDLGRGRVGIVGGRLVAKGSSAACRTTKVLLARSASLMSMTSWRSHWQGKEDRTNRSQHCTKSWRPGQKTAHRNALGQAANADCCRCRKCLTIRDLLRIAVLGMMRCRRLSGCLRDQTLWARHYCQTSRQFSGESICRHSSSTAGR